MTEPTVITTEDEYVRCKDQMHRQTIERDALNETIADISNACAVWEAEHPAADPDAQA